MTNLKLLKLTRFSLAFPGILWYNVPTMKKTTVLKIRIPETMLDDIRDVAREMFEGNVSLTARHLITLGLNRIRAQSTPPPESEPQP